MIARVITVILAALLTLPAGSSGPPSVEAKKKFTTVTRTFTNNGQIGDPNFGGSIIPYPAILEIGGFKRGRSRTSTSSCTGTATPSPAPLASCWCRLIGAMRW